MPPPAKNRLGEIQALRDLLTDSSCRGLASEIRVFLKVLYTLPSVKDWLEWLIDSDRLDAWKRLVDQADSSALTELELPDYVARQVAGDPASVGMIPSFAGLAEREVMTIMRFGGRYNSRIGIDGALALFALEKVAKEGKELPAYLMLPVLRTVFRACTQGGASGFRSMSRLFERSRSGAEGHSGFEEKDLWMWQVLDYLLGQECEEYSAKEIADSFPEGLKVYPDRAQIVSFCERWGCRCRPT
ncbi:hypothetical protein [Actomonas aquatica]|uniref:Uncharacterized protein n=1 Tax=Actomonas aquatica TaxID=2866162 RepID=A0ABZ1C474_9BACT|nr:hypothetical protein [Opitutus sp. WL0086]WRQ86517.1 hypothetical protein K1X11_017030 [Opitutus sp. WL0086]